MTILAAAFLLSLDSFFASFALGSVGIKRTRYIPMAVAFGLCDGVASLIGTAFGHRSFLWMAKNGLVFDVVTCLVLIFVALRSRKGRSGGSRFPWAAPVVLCLDNLASPGFFLSSFASVVVFILVSSFVSLLGFELAAYAKRKLGSSNPAWPKMPASLSMRNMKAIVVAGDVLRLRAESELP